MHWNFCAFANIPTPNNYNVNDTFAYVLDTASTSSQWAKPMTNDDLVLDEITTEAANTTGNTASSVSIVKDSDTPCSLDNSTMNSFEATIRCNKDITGQGAGKIVSAQLSSNGCKMEVVVEHSSGCPVINLQEVHKFLIAAKWVVGIIFIVTGPIIGMVGKRWFPWVVASGAAFLAFLCFLIFFLVVGWMSSTAGFWCFLVLSIGLGVLVGWLTKKAVWFEVGLLGVLAGWFAGSWIYSLIVAAFGWESVAFYWILEIACMIPAGILAWKYARMVVMISTAGIGSYLFCRGCGYIFGGWPSDATLMGGNAQYDEFEVGYWVYFGLTIALFIFFAFWQIKIEKGKNSEELEDHFKKYETAQE